MQIYHYKGDTGEYISTSEARLDPLETKMQEKDVYLIPAHATIQEPPQAGDNEAAVFAAGAWQIVPDHRRATYWKQDGTRYTIETLGVAPAETDLDYDPRLSVYHDYSDGEWILNRARWLDTEIRPQRDRMLNNVDTTYCNADKWENMTGAQKQAWREHKQALRDLPATIDYANPVWPTMPEK